MKPGALIILLVILLVVIGGGTAWYLVHTRYESITPPVSGTSTPSAVSPGEAIYTNGTYGFTLRYPETATVENTFTSTYHIPPTWRVNTLGDATGTPVVSIVGYSTVSDHSYPRYYYAMVRVGASSDPKEVARCLKPATDQNETALPDVTFGSTVFKAFAFQDAAMMQYEKGISYRTLHNGACVAIERIATGSSYKDDPASADDVADATLTAQYDALAHIVESFSFVEPI